MRRDIVVIGASAGGVEALQAIMRGLPADLDATVLVVLHVPPYGSSVLPTILDRAGPLPARHAVSGEVLPKRTVLVAAPDHHLVLDGDRVQVTRGPHENGHRPAIDALFRSAAVAGGPRVVGVVLSGVLDDGTAGLAAIKTRRGTTMVQDPRDALYPNMPMSALDNVEIDHTVAADKVGPLLAELCAEDAEVSDIPVEPQMEIEAEMALLDDDAMSSDDRPGQPSGFSCPDCNGVLWEIKDGELVRYRCRVGHAWSADSLLGEQAQQLDTALWMALRGLEEKAALANTLRERAEERRSDLVARRYAEQGEEASRAARLIRSMLEAHVGNPDETAASG